MSEEALEDCWRLGSRGSRDDLWKLPGDIPGADLQSTWSLCIGRARAWGEQEVVFPLQLGAAETPGMRAAPHSAYPAVHRQTAQDRARADQDCTKHRAQCCGERLWNCCRIIIFADDPSWECFHELWPNLPGSVC